MGTRLMALETVAVETFALRAISRISIGLGSRGLLLPQSYHDADRLKLENVFQTPTLGPILSFGMSGFEQGFQCSS